MQPSLIASSPGGVETLGPVELQTIRLGMPATLRAFADGVKP